MEAKIANFRRSVHRTYGNQMIIVADGVDSKEKAEKLVGKEVTWNSGVNDIKGKIASSHGNKGALRAVFEKGMPGQAIGTSVKIA